ncbi:acetyl-CoA carboxylase biotin carboxyl carrier protein subunit [soil metagenome]
MVLGDRAVLVETGGASGGLLIDDRPAAIEPVRLGAEGWSVRVEGLSYEVTVLSRDPLRLLVDGREVAMRVTDERALAAARSSGRSTDARLELRAPMPGLLKAVHVREGDAVEQGAPLVTLEAMKMENELRAADPGTVSRVAAAAGAKVDGGALLVVLTAR